jgi:hypothetical protein
MGGVTGALFLGKRSSLNDQCPLGPDRCPPSAQGDVDDYRLLGTLSPVGFVAGGALAAGGAMLLLTAPRSASPSQGRWLAPAVGLGYAGVRGAF